jgi:N-acetylmuramoyl-L-alanine amidase CwlA
MNIQKKITPYNYSTSNNRQIKYIVIHYVGAVSTAKNNADYYAREKLQASAHYFVDETSIWQSVEDKHIAWHCGTSGTYKHSECRNSNSIGIEMCCKKDGSRNWYFEQATVDNTVELVKSLMRKYNIPISNVVRHYDVTGKTCPEPYVNKPTEWDKFKTRLTSVTELVTPNDIVWELGHRGFVTDTKGMLKEMTDNPNGRLYWLARKMLHYIRTKE